METAKPREDVRDRLVTLLARHAGVVRSTIDDDASIWLYFPHVQLPYEHPSVTAFCKNVVAEFDVFVTEAEWADATVTSLAQCIQDKRADPERSLADWEGQRASVRKGTMGTFVGLNLVLAPLAVFSASGTWLSRLFATLVLLALLNLMLWLLFRRESRRSAAVIPSSLQEPRSN